MVIMSAMIHVAICAGTFLRAKQLLGFSSYISMRDQKWCRRQLARARCPTVESRLFYY
jgi:hypothetical protein